MAFQTPETYPATASFPTGSSFPASASFPSAYDPDAVSYFTASGVSDSTQKLNISQFITGVKKQNMWTNLIEGWTLRSTQNAGSGTTSYGLKGAFNGTLVNGPTWGTDGITIVAASTQYISNPRTYVFTKGEFEIFVVVNHATMTTTQQAYYAEATAGNISTAGSTQVSGHYAQSTAFLTALNGAPGGEVAISSVAPTAGTRYGLFFRGVNTGLNNTCYTKPTLTAVTNNLPAAHAQPVELGAIGAGRARTFNGVFTACFLFSKRFDSDSERDIFFNLYKNTIGQGLGLP